MIQHTKNKVKFLVSILLPKTRQKETERYFFEVSYNGVCTRVLYSVRKLESHHTS